jgi:hypothetical protein
MAKLQFTLILLLNSFAFAQNQANDCPLETAKDGAVITVHGKAAQEPHDVVFDIDGCHDPVVLAYAGDKDSEVSADQLHRDENLRRFQKYTTATYRGNAKNICLMCMKYGDVKATVTGRLQIATIPAGTTKDSFGFLHDQSGKIVGTSGFGHPNRGFKYRLVILSVSEVTARKLQKPNLTGGE